ncbi:MAG: LysR family transcriptional regulator [Sinobacteraceae bacterium]|nr:LysR family transcriptional regulator [Nevskiaceae bacterium]
MKETQLDWNDIPILLTLARAGSMREAARRLGVTTSTVSRRLAAAEKRLQVRLFIHMPDGYKPTDAGRVFLSNAEGIEASVHELISVTEAEAEGVVGKVRITSVDVIFDGWMMPRLPGLRRLYPKLEVVAIPDNHVLSFTRDEADLALRVVRPREDAAILMRRIGTFGIAVYGAGEFGEIARDRWSALPWLAYCDDLAGTPEMQWLANFIPSARIVFRCSSVTTLVKACEAGLGIALLPCVVAESTDLVRLSDAPEYQRGLWLLKHRQTAKIHRFRAVADWIVATAKKDAVLLANGVVQ